MWIVLRAAFGGAAGSGGATQALQREALMLDRMFSPTDHTDLQLAGCHHTCGHFKPLVSKEWSTDSLCRMLASLRRLAHLAGAHSCSHIRRPPRAGALAVFACAILIAALFLLPCHCWCSCVVASIGALAAWLVLLRLDLVAYTSAEVSHSCASVKFLMLPSTREF